MKFTLSWLLDHLETNASLDTISNVLTDIGLEVEEIIDNSALLKPFIIGHVVNAVQHPNADRLQQCMVDIGDEILPIICGAPNARKDIKVVVARPGDYVPGIDVTLKKGEIRGEESHGMMCSEKELLLSDAHDGIIELDNDAPIGQNWLDWSNIADPVIEINVTPNRGDCLGVRGIARDLAAAGLGVLKPLTIPCAQEVKTASPISWHIAPNAASNVPVAYGRYFSNVSNKESPKWLQDRLLAIGLRPISCLVDITNYFSYDLCRPLHVFDADKIQGDLTMRAAKNGETLHGLDGTIYDLDSSITVIGDDNAALAIGGIMGGDPSGCSMDTKNVFLEVALFDGAYVAESGRKLHINSDARYRFERHIDPAFVRDGLELATQMILDLCGGSASEVTWAGTVYHEERMITFHKERLKTHGGADIAPDKACAILEHLGFNVTRNKGDDTWHIIPPSWRQDIEGAHCIEEEILRINGFNTIEACSLPTNFIKHAIVKPQYQQVSMGKKSLVARGFFETVTWSFTSEDLADIFSKVAGHKGEQDATIISILNPINATLNVMRPSLYPNLLLAIKQNKARQHDNIALMESGPIFTNPSSQGQSRVIAGVRAGTMNMHDWRGDKHHVDIYDVKADILALCDAVDAPSSNMRVIGDKVPPYYHPTRSAALMLGAVAVGYFGEMHPAILQEHGVKTRVVGFELFMDRLPVAKKRKNHTRPLLKQHDLLPVKRDFSFTLQRDITAQQILDVIRKSDKNLISNCQIFDEFILDDTQKSLAVRVILQPQDSTLTDDVIQDVSQKIITNIGTILGAHLR